MKTLLIKENAETSIEEIKEDDTLKEMYRVIDTNLVDLLRQVPFKGDNNFDMWFCDEGKLREKTPTVLFENEQGEIVDFIAGNTLVATANDDGDTTGLTQEQILQVYNTLTIGVINFQGNPLRVFVYKAKRD